MGNSTLPLPQSSLEENNLMKVFTNFGIKSVSPKSSIMLDITDSKFEGDWYVSSAMVNSNYTTCYGNCSYKSLTYTNWQVGQPNDQGNQDYASISYKDNKWGDWTGNRRARVICQQQLIQPGDTLTATVDPASNVTEDTQCNDSDDDCSAAQKIILSL